MTTSPIPLEFVVTPSDHGPVVRAHVDVLARATGLDVRPKYGHPVVDRDQAVALVAFAGATLGELRAVGAAFDVALAEAAVGPRAAFVAPPAPAVTTPERIASVTHMRPRHEAAPATPSVAQTPTRAAAPTTTAQAARPMTRKEVADAAEKDAILKALETTKGNKVRAAQIVGMARRTFYRRLREYGLMDDDTIEGDDAPEVEVAPPPPPVVEAPVFQRRKPGRKVQSA